MRTFGAVNALFESRPLPVSKRSGCGFADVLGSDFFVAPRWMFIETLDKNWNLRAEPTFPRGPVGGRSRILSQRQGNSKVAVPLNSPSFSAVSRRCRQRSSAGPPRRCQVL